MTEERQHFEAWGIVDLFGHTQTAGRISEQTIGGETFIRVDVPTGESFHTALYGKGAIYSIRLTDETLAREMAKRIAPRPVRPYEVGNLLEDKRQEDERNNAWRRQNERDPIADDDPEDDEYPL